MKLIKNKKEREAMFISGQKLAKIFNSLSFEKLINKTTKEVDILIKTLLDNEGMISQCKGYKGYPAYSCISINEELVHGIPKERKILETDLVKVDICASFNGFCADTARPYAFFNNNKIFNNMKECAEKALNAGINAVKKNNFVGCISESIEKIIKEYNYEIVRDFAGHGIGKRMHEEPEIPNYGIKRTGQKLYIGMAFAIEPMFCENSHLLIIDNIDKWTVKTKNNDIAMHIEDTVYLDDNDFVITTRLQ
jgi:methionyl aminopeptidase